MVFFQSVLRVVIAVVFSDPYLLPEGSVQTERQFKKPLCVLNVLGFFKTEGTVYFLQFSN